MQPPWPPQLAASSFASPSSSKRAMLASRRFNRCFASFRPTTADTRCDFPSSATLIGGHFHIKPSVHCRQLALFGTPVVSDESPQCATKRTSLNASHFHEFRKRASTH